VVRRWRPFDRDLLTAVVEEVIDARVSGRVIGPLTQKGFDLQPNQLTVVGH
jgi:hypothetical protein